MPYKQYQLNPPYYGYQKVKRKKIYQIDNKDYDDHLEGFYTILKYKVKQIQYSNKSFDKLDTNFVRIESFYQEYENCFFSKSQLHKYLKDNCTSSIHSLRLVTWLPNLLIPIINSKAVVLAKELGLVFWEWIYATAAITFVSQVVLLKTDASAIICLNIGYDVTFIDKA